MTNCVKCKGQCSSVEVGNPILGDCRKIIVHNITKHLKMFMSVTSHRV
jgi:hypothetical protein